MKNMSFLFSLILATAALFSCNNAQKINQTDIKGDKKMVSNTIKQDTLKKLVKSDAEWKEELNELEYDVLRQKGTERSFTGDLWDNKEKGIYTCRGCQLPLFSSDTKFKSGTGWPSFYEPIKDIHIAEEKDDKYGWNRVEVLCARCDGHLGHVFDDGPKPTGLRYCINSVSLDFVADKAP